MASLAPQFPSEMPDDSAMVLDIITIEDVCAREDLLLAPCDDDDEDDLEAALGVVVPDSPMCCAESEGPESPSIPISPTEACSVVISGRFTLLIEPLRGNELDHHDREPLDCSDDDDSTRICSDDNARPLDSPDIADPAAAVLVDDATRFVVEHSILKLTEVERPLQHRTTVRQFLTTMPSNSFLYRQPQMQAYRYYTPPSPRTLAGTLVECRARGMLCPPRKPVSKASTLRAVLPATNLTLDSRSELSLGSQFLAATLSVATSSKRKAINFHLPRLPTRSEICQRIHVNAHF
ncbi:uncharacterized protein BJ171DRAFT_514058 [Polychytrium aggregatum]|uniref:uncharacterized protein n=1 Tax=Polychytrium aggregatum TaxID=110093 RepID=UPI0022FECB66|nr:uncharacterized protein BJ171DRAFT_514058 [Polychytrium aggregatum]KAI9202437.1 hypothetical protein BJ171DRAFT_514058 [Polychytrium aggregatum]